MAGTGVPVARNFVVLFLGNALGQVLFLIGTIHLARAVGPAAYGWWGFAHALFGYLLLGSDLGLEVTGIRALGRDSSVASVRIGRVMSLRLILAAVLVAATCVVALVGVLPADSVTLVVILSFGVIAMAVSLEWAFEGLQTPIYSGLSRVVKGVLFLALVVSFVHGPEDLHASAVFYDISLIVPALLLIVIAARIVGRPKMHISGAVAKDMIAEAVPIGVAALLSQYSLFFGTIYLGYTASAVDLGLFSAAARLVIFGWAYGIVAANRVLLPQLSRFHEQSVEDFHRFVRAASRVLLIAALPIGFAGSVLSALVVSIIYGQSFLPSAPVFAALVWALVVAVASSIYEISLVASNRQGVYLQGMVMLAILQTVAAPLGMAMAGITGLATAMVFAQVCYAVFVFVRSHAFTVTEFFRASWKILLAAVMAFVASRAALPSPILAAGIAVAVYFAILWGSREVTGGDVLLLRRLLGLK